MKKIPLHSLIILVGPSGAGKSTLASSKFEHYEIISSDRIREELVGDVERQDVNDMVFRELHRRVALKLELGERVVVDSTNLIKRDRLPIAEVGIRIGLPVFYVVVNRSISDKEKSGSWRVAVPGLVQKQEEMFKLNEREILRGDSVATVIDTRVDEFDVIKKYSKDNVLEDIKQRGYRGITVVGDVHGNLEALKSAIDWAFARGMLIAFLGDIVDYGPYSLECVNLVYDLVMRDRAIMTWGNHERKIERWFDQQRKVLHDPHYLKNKNPIRLSDGNKATTTQIEALPLEARVKFESRFRALLGFARHHWVIGGKTIFVHGAADPEMFSMNTSRLTGRLETMAMFGEVSEKTPQRDDGFPNRVYNWVDRVPNGHRVIVGHDIRSTERPLVVKGALGGEAVFMDTGSSKGGKLTTADLTIKGDELMVQNFTTH
jgi:protein phosphatase